MRLDSLISTECGKEFHRFREWRRARFNFASFLRAWEELFDRLCILHGLHETRSSHQFVKRDGMERRVGLHLLLIRSVADRDCFEKSMIMPSKVTHIIWFEDILTFMPANRGGFRKQGNCDQCNAGRKHESENPLALTFEW